MKLTAMMIFVPLFYGWLVVALLAIRLPLMAALRPGRIITFLWLILSSVRQSHMVGGTTVCSHPAACLSHLWSHHSFRTGLSTTFCPSLHTRQPRYQFRGFLIANQSPCDRDLLLTMCSYKKSASTLFLVRSSCHGGDRFSHADCPTDRFSATSSWWSSCWSAWPASGSALAPQDWSGWP